MIALFLRDGFRCPPAAVAAPDTIRLTGWRAWYRGGFGAACINSAAFTGFASSIALAVGHPTVSRSEIEKAPLTSSLGKSMNEELDGKEERNEPSDTELLRQMAGGDALAFANFYDRYSSVLFSVALKVLHDVHEAEEVLQEAACLVWENASLYNSTLGKPSSWAVVITRNKAIDRLRALQRKGEAIARITEEAARDFSAQGHGIPSDAITNETGALLRNALKSLPAEQQLAIELAFFVGLSQTEIATKLGQPLGTIKARIRRGMLAMREILEVQR